VRPQYFGYDPLHIAMSPNPGTQPYVGLGPRQPAISSQQQAPYHGAPNTGNASASSINDPIQNGPASSAKRKVDPKPLIPGTTKESTEKARKVARDQRAQRRQAAENRAPSISSRRITMSSLIANFGSGYPINTLPLQAVQSGQDSRSR
jgi:hypothetical protein